MSFLALIELNELNFEYVRFYAARGQLPCLSGLIQEHGICETRSEDHHEHLEPWIQWVTAHTGKTFSEHGVFRLGDIVHHDIPQIWEMLEAHGIKVGAVSPMNAKHRLSNPAFFVPDPWTPTAISALPPLARLYRSLCQAVNDNARGRLTVGSLVGLIQGFAVYARPRNYVEYVRLAATSRSRPWRRAMILDLLLADVFIREVARTRPAFATLFVNAAAHIQHHYMFSSAAYDGVHRNPPWYMSTGDDPLLEVYSVYDRVIAQIRDRFPGVRLMLATGLHQDPHGKVTFYWRLRNHAEFLRKIGVPFRHVSARMSRDFVVECESDEQARAAQARLASAVTLEGTPLFEIDNRGKDLFVMLTHSNDVPRGFRFRVGDMEFADFDADVVFVALKNGEHNGAGYFLDTGAPRVCAPSIFPLSDIPGRIMAAFGLPHFAGTPAVDTRSGR